MEFLSVLAASLLAVASLFAVTKLMGKRQISQLSFFDYVCGITIGSIAAELATELEDFWKPLTALIIFAVFEILFAFVCNKSPLFRRLIDGKPKLLYSNGKLNRNEFARSRLDLEEFTTALRVAGYSSLTDVRAAVLETNGRISFIPTAAKRPVTNSDMGLAPEEDCYSTPLIQDGVVFADNLKAIGKDRNWLDKNLALQGFKDAKKVFYATSDGDSLTVFGIESD